MNQVSAQSSSGFPSFHGSCGGPKILSGSFHTSMCSRLLAGYTRRVQALQLIEAAQLKPSWPKLVVDAFDNGDDSILSVKGFRASNRLRAYGTIIRVRLKRIEARDEARSALRTRSVHGFLAP